MKSPDKAAWRRHVRELVRALPAEARAAASSHLRGVLSAQPIWSRAASVLCFAPLASEPDITFVMDEAWRANKTVALPRYDAGGGRYLAAKITARSQLVSGLFGTLEPSVNCPAMPLNQLDLALVPGVAFDLAGRRLGRGKGFYDRLLAEVSGHKCGVAFDVQVVAEIPEEPHDVRVDSILTPSRWHLCQRAV
jgi:5-formyltetrahydrofolate cyclo-ligase